MKKIMFLFLITLLIFTSFNVLTYATEGEVDNTPPVVNQNPTIELPRIPKLIVTSPSSQILLNAGESKTVKLAIKNIGNGPARDFLIIPQSVANLSVRVSDTLTIMSIPAGQTIELSMEVTANSNAETGSATATLDITYKDNDRTQYSSTGSVIANIKNEKTTETLNMNVKDISLSNTNIVAEDEFTLSATLENTSTLNAKNVQVVLEGLEKEGIILKDNMNNVYYENFGGKISENISFKLTSAKKAKGSYPLTLTVKYKDKDGKDGTNSFSYYVTIKDKSKDDENSDKANIIIQEIQAPTQTFDTGQTFTISYTITNTGVKEAKNIKVVAKTEETKPIVPKSANTIQIQKLAPNESKRLDFSFTPTSTSATQNYSIGFAIEFENGIIKEDETKEKDTFEQFVGINVVNTKADEKAKKEEEDKIKDEEKDKLKDVPKIIISKYNVEPLLVMAGSEFDLSMVFKNTHSVKDVKNIKAILTVPSSTSSTGVVSADSTVFSPVNASNTFYVEKINKSSSVEEKIKLYCVPDAAPKNYVIIVKFEYEDNEGNPITAQEEIGINVRQNAKYELGEVVIPPNMNVNEAVTPGFSILNSGKVTLSNFKIKFVGEGFETAGTEVIYGKFEAGNYEDYSAVITPIEAGEKTLKLVVDYDDDTGKHINEEIEYKVVVAETMGGSGGGSEDYRQRVEQDEKGNMIMRDANGMPFIVTIDETTGEKLANGKPIEFDGFGNPIAPKASLVSKTTLMIAGGVVGGIVAISIIVVVIRKKKKGLDSSNE